MAVPAALEVCFGNHIYQCVNELLRQVTSGGIGARVTGVVARVLMGVWHSVPRGGKNSLFDMPNFRHKDSFSSNIS